MISADLKTSTDCLKFFCNVKRGDIYYANLTGVLDSEQGGTRPVVILQNDIGNKYSPTTVVVPLTSKNKKKQVTHVQVSNESGLSVDSIAMTEQIKCISKRRLFINGNIKKIGQCHPQTLKQIEVALLKELGLTTQYAI
jgi:mRNA interferase MazF